MQTPYFFELLGESKDMPIGEIRGCLRAECDEFQINKIGPGYVIATFDDSCFNGVADRISLSHSIGRFLCTCTLDDLSGLESIELPPGSFAIRGKRFAGMMHGTDTQDLIRRAGKILSRNNDVDLKNPDVTVRMCMSDSINIFLEDKVVAKDLLEKRKVGERPFFSPISLHPKYARALINMTGVKRGGTVLDPFCGTGGIAIEAADMGMKAMVSDFDEEMVFGCMENMDFYGLALSKSEICDIRDIPSVFSEIDSIATDPPYGRSTKTGGENVNVIYSWAFDAIPKVLKKGSYAGIVLPHPTESSTMKREDVYEQYVHGSLTRYYHVFHNN